MSLVSNTGLWPSFLTTVRNFGSVRQQRAATSRFRGKIRKVAPRRDPRWKDQGIRIPHQRTWSEQASLWSVLLPEPGILDGPFQLLHTARSLFIHSWYDCDFLTVAVMVASQSVEAALRVLYPELGKKSSFQALIKRATVDGHLSDEQVEPAHDLREMRNLLAHPLAHANIDILPTVNLMGFAHEIVASIMTAVQARDGSPVSHRLVNGTSRK
jgi:hypothetical protein